MLLYVGALSQPAALSTNANDVHLIYPPLWHLFFLSCYQREKVELLSDGPGDICHFAQQTTPHHTLSVSTPHPRIPILSIKTVHNLESGSPSATVHTFYCKKNKKRKGERGGRSRMAAELRLPQVFTIRQRRRGVKMSERDQGVLGGALGQVASHPITSDGQQRGRSALNTVPSVGTFNYNSSVSLTAGPHRCWQPFFAAWLPHLA